MKKLICWFKGHDLEVAETQTVIGSIFGQPCEAHRYICQRCGKNDGEWCVTETITFN